MATETTLYTVHHNIAFRLVIRAQAWWETPRKFRNHPHTNRPHVVIEKLDGEPTAGWSRTKKGAIGAEVARATEQRRRAMIELERADEWLAGLKELRRSLVTI